MPLSAIRPLFSHSLVRDLGRKPNSEPHPKCSEVGSRLTGEPSETPTRRLAWPPNHVNHDKRPVGHDPECTSRVGMLTPTCRACRSVKAACRATLIPAASQTPDRDGWKSP